MTLTPDDLRAMRERCERVSAARLDQLVRLSSYDLANTATSYRPLRTSSVHTQELLELSRSAQDAKLALNEIARLQAEEADIRSRLGGAKDSRLDGENGLAAATKNRLDALEAALTVERIEAALHALYADWNSQQHAPVAVRHMAEQLHDVLTAKDGE